MLKNSNTHTHLLRVRSPTCLGQNLDPLCYAGLNHQDNNYDGNEHNTVDDEEGSETSESWKMFGLYHRGRALGRGDTSGFVKEKSALRGCCLLKSVPPPRQQKWNALSVQDIGSHSSRADSWFEYRAEVRILASFSSRTDFRTGRQAQNALPCNKYEKT